MARAQAHTLEAFTAALLLLSAVVFALNATAVTPLTASTSNQHVENQERAMAGDVLATAADNGSLREALLYWNVSGSAFARSTDQGFYVDGGPPTPFGRELNQTFRAGRIAFNVYLTYHRPNGDSGGTQTMVFMGTPSDNAVTATRTVTLYDDSRLTAPTATGNVSSSGFYAPDASPGSTLYNVVEVHLVVWKM